jgi:hypothetical protein
MKLGARVQKFLEFKSQLSVVRGGRGQT